MKIPPFSLRYKLLDFLYRVYPESVDEFTILEVFYEYHKVDNIKKQLHYLIDAGYVESKEIAVMFGSKKKTLVYKISPKGIDLINGIIQDKAVPIPEEDE